MLCIVIAIHTQRGHILHKYSIKYTSHSLYKAQTIEYLSRILLYGWLSNFPSLELSSLPVSMECSGLTHAHIMCTYTTKKSASIPLAHRFMHKLVVDCCIYQFITANSTIYQGWMDYLVDRFETEKCVCLAPEYFLCISYVNARDCWRGRIFVANEGTLSGFRHVCNISNNSSNSGIVHRWNIGADDDTSWIRRFADAPNSMLKFVPTTMAVENRPTVYRSHAIER